MDHEEIKLNGCTIEIHQDEDAQGPEDWVDDSMFLVGYHRDFTVDRGKRDKDGRYTPGISQGLAQCIARGGKYEDNSINDEAREYIKKYFLFPLEAYIHSGVVLALGHEGNFPDRQWDVSQLGLVFVHRTKLNGKLSAKQARKYALGLIEEWNQYLSGQVYGYITKDEQGNHLDSCWSFYGDPKESGLLDEARASINRYVEDKRKELSGISAGA